MRKMITLGRKRVVNYQEIHMERSLLLKNGAPIMLPVDSFVTSHVQVRVRGGMQGQEIIERVKLVLHNENVLALLKEVEIEAPPFTAPGTIYKRLLWKDNCIFTKITNTLLAKDDRLFLKLLMVGNTTSVILHPINISPFVKKLLLAHEIDLLPELTCEIFRLFLLQWSMHAS